MRVRSWPVFGTALVILIVGAACVIEMVTHPASAMQGTTFRAVVTLKGTQAEYGTHTVCVGLNDPDTKGWTATEQGWLVTQGISHHPIGAPGVAWPDDAREAFHNGEHPAYAPFKCWSASMQFTTKNNLADAYFDIGVAETATAGVHQFMWIYEANAQTSTTTTNIEIEAAPEAFHVIEEPPRGQLRRGRPGHRQRRGC